MRPLLLQLLPWNGQRRNQPLHLQLPVCLVLVGVVVRCSRHACLGQQQQQRLLRRSNGQSEDSLRQQHSSNSQLGLFHLVAVRRQVLQWQQRRLLLLLCQGLGQLGASSSSSSSSKWRLHRLALVPQLLLLLHLVDEAVLTGWRLSSPLQQQWQQPLQSSGASHLLLVPMVSLASLCNMACRPFNSSSSSSSRLRQWALVLLLPGRVHSSSSSSSSSSRWRLGSSSSSSISNRWDGVGSSRQSNSSKQLPLSGSCSNGK
jgi:hypothetical protein